MTRPLAKFIDVAAEYFLLSIASELSFETNKPEKSIHRLEQAVIGIVVLGREAQLLRTLGILVHASQNAPKWLAIIAPDALESAVAIGTRPISHMETEDDEMEPGHKKEASVLTSGLGLALIVLGRLLVTSDLTKDDCPRPETVRLLHTTGSGLVVMGWISNGKRRTSIRATDFAASCLRGALPVQKHDILRDRGDGLGTCLL